MANVKPLQSQKGVRPAPSETGMDLTHLWQWMDPIILQMAKEQANTRNEQVKDLIERVVAESCIEALWGTDMVENIQSRLDISAPEFLNMIFEALKPDTSDDSQS